MSPSSVVAAIEPLEITSQHENTNPCCRIIEVKYQYVIDESSCSNEHIQCMCVHDNCTTQAPGRCELGADQHFYSAGSCKHNCDRMNRKTQFHGSVQEGLMFSTQEEWSPLRQGTPTFGGGFGLARAIGG